MEREKSEVVGCLIHGGILGKFVAEIGDGKDEGGGMVRVFVVREG